MSAFHRVPWATAGSVGMPHIIVDADGQTVTLMPTAELARNVVDAVNARSVVHQRGVTPWRLGKDDPARIEDGGGVPIGWMYPAELAAIVVAAVNAHQIKRG